MKLLDYYQKVSYYTHLLSWLTVASPKGVKNLRITTDSGKQHNVQPLMLVDILVAFWMHYSIQHTYSKESVDVHSFTTHVA